MKKILVIAPHADDEILGLGGTISKYVEKSYQVIVLIMTNANKGNPKDYPENLINKIRKESRAANKIIGVKELIFYVLIAYFYLFFPVLFSKLYYLYNYIQKNY